jgi:hypothetical protein
MRRWGKALARAGVYTAGALLLLVLALHLFLSVRLNRLLREAVFPLVAQAYGVQVQADDASLNLLGGSMKLRGLAVANPPGFPEPSVVSVHATEADLDLLALARGVIQVSRARTDRAQVVVTHDRENRFNVVELQRRVKDNATRRESGVDRPPAPPSAGIAPRRRAPPSVPRVLLRDFSADVTLTYVDHFVAAEPLSLAFQTRLEADNVATYDTGSPFWGGFALKGHLADDPRAFVTDLRGRVAPLTDPARPSFDLNGQIAAVDWQRLRPLLRKTEVECDSADVRVRLVCRRGTFVTPDSVLMATLRNARPTGKLARKVKGWPLPRDVTVAVPVQGELDDPKLDLQGALLRSILESLAGNVDGLMKALNVDQRAADDLGRALKTIGEALLAPPPRTNGAARAASPAGPAQ